MRAVFRADCGPGIGNGHVVRGLALARALAADGWRIGLAFGESQPGSLPRLAPFEALSMAGCDESAEPAALAARWPEGCDLLVADHYGRGAAFESACRPWARRILAIDDIADRAHDCDILLDQSPGRRAADYDGLDPPQCLRLIGPDHALLRPQFACLRGLAETRPGPARRVVVTMGATDSKNATGLVLDGLARLETALEIDVALGRAAPHLAAIRERIAAFGGRARLHVEVEDMAALMTGADFAIGAGGVGAIERCCLGLPAVVIETADNQRRVITGLAMAGAIVTLGPRRGVDAAAVARAAGFLASDGDARRLMAARAAMQCDGLGTARVALALAQAPTARDGRPVALRPARPGDAETVLPWQQDPATRRHFRNPAPPRREDHIAWFGRRLADPRSHMEMILHGGAPAGVLRLDRRGDTPDGPAGFEVSILVAPGSTGMGIGRIALGLARRLMPTADLFAEVADANLASQRIFAASGYRPENGWLVSRAADAAPAGRTATA